MNLTDDMGQVAIVTGGAGRLGQAIASRLGRSGSKVAIWDHCAMAMNGRGSNRQDPDVLRLPVDVRNLKDISSALDKTLSVFGRLDVLVNNAGILGPVTEIWNYPAEDWRRVIDVNLTGAFLCCQAVVPVMLRQGAGRIVNVSSIQGKEGTPLSGAYAASKAAMIALTKTLGKELATTGVTVNCVTPAAFDSAMFHEIGAERREDILARIPMMRFCSAEEVAAMIAWICSSECTFSTGSVFDISGGRATY